jgi:glycerol kinase
MPRSHILALDQGTTSSRSIVFDASGAVCGSAQREFAQRFPQPGWVEHDANEIWSTQLDTARGALKIAGVTATDIAAIGITNQRETVVVWERTSGHPIAPAIVWQDRRTALQIDALRASGIEPMLVERTGLLLDPYFSATKIAWLLDHVPGARSRAERGELAVGTIDSWLLWNLTGGAVHVTDVTNASRTMLMDRRTLTWDPELLSVLRVPAAILPRIQPSDAAFGMAKAELLGAEIPVHGILGDQQAALFGQRCTEPSMAKNTFGTGCFMLMQTGTCLTTSRYRLLGTVAWQRSGEPACHAFEGSVFVGGSAIQWLRDGLGIIRSAPDVNALAASVPDAGGVMMVPAFTGLGAPHWDPQARGAMLGITRGTTAAHVARATLEGITHQVADLAEAMDAEAGTPLSLLRVDGGASASDLLMQMQSDLLGIPLERPRVVETTAQGAAFMAGLGCGLWADATQLARVRAVDRIFQPTWTVDRRAQARARWKRAVECSRGWHPAEERTR